MKVKELIEILQQHDPEMSVHTPQYQRGEPEIKIVQIYYSDPRTSLQIKNNPPKKLRHYVVLRD